MPILSFLKRHSHFAEQASAYADGELRGRDLELFEAHLAGCKRCTETIANARTLKAALSSLPDVEPARSFRLTPAMLEQARPTRQPSAGTPLYLGLARVAAGLSVFAFVGAFAFSALSGPDDSGGRLASTEMSDAGYTQDDAFATKSAPESLVPSAQVSVTPQIGPATTSGGAASGLETPPAGSSDAPNRTAAGEDASSAPPQAAADAGEDGDSGPISAIGIDSAGNRVAADEDDSGISSVVIALGFVSAIAVVVLGGLELRRRAENR